MGKNTEIDLLEKVNLLHSIKFKRFCNIFIVILLILAFL